MFSCCIIQTSFISVPECSNNFLHAHLYFRSMSACPSIILSLAAAPSLRSSSSLQKPGLVFLCCRPVRLFAYVRSYHCVLTTCQHMQPARNWNVIFFRYSISTVELEVTLLFRFKLNRVPVNLKWSYKTDSHGLSALTRSYVRCLLWV